MTSVVHDQITIIPDTLYFYTVAEKQHLQSTDKQIYFTIDTTFIYTAFFADFGPLHLGHTFQFCEMLDNMIKLAGERKKIVFYSSVHPHRRANSAVLILAYLIFVKKYTIEQAYAPFMGISPPFTTFRDAAFCINTYPITVLDCCRAMYRAASQQHFNYTTFSITDFERLSKLENGDISWIIPGKFIAFSGPIATPREISPGVFALSPEEYVPLFKSLGVSCVVRFNKKCYDRAVFVRAGIRHYDLYYEDGGNPTEAILQAFLEICERESGAIAVHCKAGLGRTGTNIAAYMMKHYDYTAAEATAWCRICRPGCVVGPQQQYLESIQEKMWEEGARYRARGGVSRREEGAAARLNNVMTNTGKKSLLPKQQIKRRNSRENNKTSSVTTNNMKPELLRRPSTSGGNDEYSSKSKEMTIQGTSSKSNGSAGDDAVRMHSSFAVNGRPPRVEPLADAPRPKTSNERRSLSAQRRNNTSHQSGSDKLKPVEATPKQRKHSLGAPVTRRVLGF